MMTEDKIYCENQLSDSDIEKYGNGAIICEDCGGKKLKGIMCFEYDDRR
jgi:hypothetical protein